MNQFTVGLALQYARQGIRVNAIMPGLMNTPLVYRQISGRYADADAMARARREATPTPDDVGRDPVAGILVGADDQEMVIRRSDPRAGTSHVHFPRARYDLVRV